VSAWAETDAGAITMYELLVPFALGAATLVDTNE